MSAPEREVLAMSESMDWFAYPKSMFTRAQAMSRLASAADDIGYGDWWDTLHNFRARSGYVVRTDYPERGWWYECDAYTPDAVPVWLITRRAASVLANPQEDGT